MAGMRPFVLSQEFASAYCDSLASDGCPSSQIAIVKPSAVPLWKVIVGPRADKLKPDPQGSGFLFADRATGTRPKGRRGVAQPRRSGLWPHSKRRLRHSRLPRILVASNENIQGDHYGLDHADPCRDLPRPRDQRLPAGRALIAPHSLRLA